MDSCSETEEDREAVLVRDAVQYLQNAIYPPGNATTIKLESIASHTASSKSA